jgi:glycerol-3-phosphate cytidylyltransferase
MRILYTGGTMDVLHAGHVNFLRQCKAIAGKEGRVVVSLNTDEFIESYKGVKPVFNYEERKTLLEQLEYVDGVIPNIGGADSKPAILQVKPNFIVIGSDWASKDYYAQMQFTQKWLDDQGIVLIYVPYTSLISTSLIKERIKSGK